MGNKNVEKTAAFLQTNNLACVCVDEPQGFKSSIPPVSLATSDEVSLVRLRGRNTATWEVKGQSASDRFNYVYSQQEFAEWIPKIETLASKSKRIHLLMNTNKQDQGPAN